MAEGEEESLESLLNKATNPARRDEDWEYIMAFCDQVNKELEGPMHAVKLLAHKIQSPQEREALFALTTVESCVKNCGKRFHAEIGKFRFLNEMIKVISPKYLGNATTEKVKKRCIELLYSWSIGLQHEMKIQEAYQMLKKQNIVTQDPTYVDKTFEPPPPPRPKNSIFEDGEKAKLLARLLKSKNPEDLQAANRLIKNMVRQDTERMEKVSKRVTELETVGNNVKLLGEMLEHYQKDTTSAGDKDLMKELNDNLEKQRPNLFRLASDTDEKDDAGISEILKANDSVMKIMNEYRRVVEGSTEKNGTVTNGQKNANASSSLLDLEFDASAPRPPAPSSADRQESSSSSILLDDELAVLGLNESGSQGAASTTNNTNKQTSDLDELGDIFATPTNTTNTTNNAFGLAGGGGAGFGLQQSMSQSPFTGTPQHVAQQPFGSQPMAQPTLGQLPMGQPPFAQQPMGQQPFRQPLGQQVFNQQQLAQRPMVPMAQGLQQQQPISQHTVPTSSVFGGLTSQPLSQPLAPTGSASGSGDGMSALDDLDMLGQSLLQQSLPADKKITVSSPAPKIPMNQMQKPASPIPGQTAATSTPAKKPTPASTVTPMATPPVSQSPISTPPVSATASPKRTPQHSVSSPAGPKPGAPQVQSLADVFVPLDTIQPASSVQPLTAYDKNGIKIVFHFGKDNPRPDVLVVVVSVMSTNTNPVKNFMYQAAVPKVMKVKLQPASATDLPAYNPILPPAAITQVMLIANPQKEKIRLKYKISFGLDTQTITDVGEVDNFPS